METGGVGKRCLPAAASNMTTPNLTPTQIERQEHASIAFEVRSSCRLWRQSPTVTAKRVIDRKWGGSVPASGENLGATAMTDMMTAAEFMTFGTILGWLWSSVGPENVVTPRTGLRSW